MAMNLGDARLSHVSASRPLVSRAESRQSVAASDDYYSISDASSDTKETVLRYQTPPLRSESAASERSQTARRPEPMAPHPEVAEPNTRAASMSSQRPASRQERVWQDPHVDASAPTPGLDDSPYIQFAIDQLTRDEEVSGRNRVSRDSRVAAPAPAITRSARQSRMASSKYSSGQNERAIPEETTPMLGPERTSAEQLIPPPVLRDANDEPGTPTSSLFPPFDPERERARPILLPAQPGRNDYRYPALDFVPAPLRFLPILALIVLCLGLAAILIISTVLGARNYGLLGYDGVGTGRYFLFEYLPQFLAVIVIVWLFVIQAAIQRILPFALLARSNGYPDEDVATKIPIYLTNYILPNASLLRQGIGLKFCAVVFWLALFTVPLASSLYQTRWYAQVSAGSFQWTTVQPISIILIILYLLLVIALIITYLHFRRHTTGLKWDPISLADIIVLIRRTSNLTSSRTSKTTRNSSARPHSLGYWESTSRPGLIFHGIGVAHETPLASNEKQSMEDPEAYVPVQQSTFESWHSNHWRRGDTQPAFLRETWLILYAITALVLLIAFLVVTYLHRALEHGFIPLLMTATSATSSFSSFSPSDFLYSFVPSFLGLLLPLFWHSIDTAFRYLQPWSTLSRGKSSAGHTASSTLLLSYPSTLPFLTTIRAASAGHLKLAWFSLLSLISWAIPVLAGGMFTAQFIGNDTASANNDQARSGSIVIRPDPRALYALTAFLILYAFSWLLLLPGAKRRAVTGPDGRPIDVRYLAGIRSVVDKSVLREPIWAEPRTRTDLVTRLVASEGTRSKTGGRWAMAGGRLVRT